MLDALAIGGIPDNGAAAEVEPEVRTGVEEGDGVGDADAGAFVAGACTASALVA